MQTCKHCGAACQALQRVLILQRDGSAWHTECCEECKQKYQRQNAAERKRREKQKHYTGMKR